MLRRLINCRIIIIIINHTRFSVLEHVGTLAWPKWLGGNQLTAQHPYVISNSLSIWRHGQQSNTSIFDHCHLDTGEPSACLGI